MTKDLKRVTAKAVRKNVREIAKELGHAPEKHEYFDHPKCLFTEARIRGHFQGGWNKVLSLSGFEPVKEPKVEIEKGSPAELSIKLKQAREEIQRLTHLQAETESKALTSEKMRELIMGTDRDYTPDIEWLKGPKVPKSTTGRPCLFLSDLHFDEVVNPDQVGGSNRFNRAIAEKRLKTTLRNFVELYRYQLSKPKYDGCSLPLGGDLVSGNIHEELAETNEACINQTVLRLEELLIDAIEFLAEEFGKVFVPCVTGNHGRIHKKPRAKNSTFENYEWLIYMHLARHFKNDPRVSVLVAEGTDLVYPIYGKNYRLMHGFEFNGGGGIGGIMVPIFRGLAKDQVSYQAMGRPFDVTLMGHWHQYSHMSQLVINGSLKGYDEFAKLIHASFEPAQQAAWIDHPEHGMVVRTPIICDSVK